MIGGGLELASATHIRVAEPSAFYALPEGQHGLFVGGGGSVRVPRLIGAHRMADMMLTGRVLDAEEGQALGLSHYLDRRRARAWRSALELAEKIAANSPVTNFAVLQALPRIAEANPARGLPAGVADGRGRAAAASRPRSGCRRSCRAAAERCSGDRAAPELLRPGRRRRPGRRTEIGRFLGWLAETAACDFDDYAALHRWSVDGPRRASGRRSGSSSACAAHTPYERCSAGGRCRAREWFPGATLNYAEHAARARRPDRDADEVAVVGLLADPRPASS